MKWKGNDVIVGTIHTEAKLLSLPAERLSHRFSLIVFLNWKKDLRIEMMLEVTYPPCHAGLHMPSKYMREMVGPYFMYLHTQRKNLKQQGNVWHYQVSKDEICTIPSEYPWKQKCLFGQDLLGRRFWISQTYSKYTWRLCISDYIVNFVKRLFTYSQTEYFLIVYFSCVE